MTRVILTVFFYLILTPYGWLIRMTGKRPLDLSWPDERETYWVERKPTEASLERYRKQY